MSLRSLAFAAKLAVAGRRSRDAYEEFVRNDGLSPDAIEALSARRSIEHARFAFDHSPFYRELYGSHGFTAADLDDVDAFQELPFIDKAMVRENFGGIATDEASGANTSISKTGGSTGLPLRILRDLRFPARALEWRLFDWWGVRPWDDRGIVTRHVLTGAARLRHDLGWLPSRRVQLDAFAIDDPSVRAFVAAWNRLRPPFLLGYGGGVLDLARRVERLGLDFHAPRAIAVTASPLTPGVRDAIESTLGGTVYDHYRSAEVPWIGGECGVRSGLHVFADCRRIEIVDDLGARVGAGVEGEVVATDLTNRAFPLVRYRLGDVSSFRDGECACGRGLPRLGVISGRASDAVRLPDGTTIAGALGHIFDDHPLAVRQFEIVQSADYAVTLRYVAGAVWEPGVRRAEELLRRALRGTVPLVVERVDEITQTGGKMRFIRSDAPPTTAAS